MFGADGVHLDTNNPLPVELVAISTMAQDLGNQKYADYPVRNTIVLVRDTDTVTYWLLHLK